MLQTLDTIISVVFVFLMFSLVVSAAREVFAAWLRLRSKMLKAGLNVLLNNLSDQKLADDFWSHPFIKAVQPSGDAPSYIPSANIAAALLHIAAGNKSGEAVDVTKLKALLAGLPHKGLATIIATAIEQSGAGATLIQVQASLEKWVDVSMERISSLYHRKTRTWLFLISLLTAAAMNVDTVTIWNRVQSDKALRDSLVAQAATARLPATVQNVLKQVDGASQPDAAMNGDADVAAAAKQYRKNLDALTDLGLPIGWTDEALALYTGFWASVLHVLGILASAFAASLGAPFWFDLLQRFMNVRSAIKPMPLPAKPEAK